MTNDKGKHKTIWSSCPAALNRIPALLVSKDKHANEASKILLLVKKIKKSKQTKNSMNLGFFIHCFPVTEPVEYIQVMFSIFPPSLQNMEVCFIILHCNENRNFLPVLCFRIHTSEESSEHCQFVRKQNRQNWNSRGGRSGVSSVQTFYRSAKAELLLKEEISFKQRKK